MERGARDISPSPRSCQGTGDPSRSAVEWKDHKQSKACPWVQHHPGVSTFSCPEVGFIPIILGIFIVNATTKNLCCFVRQQLSL